MVQWHFQISRCDCQQDYAAHMLLRILATLAFAASFDILIMDGKYLSAVDKVAVAIFQSF